jgi:aspartate racemase
MKSFYLTFIAGLLFLEAKRVKKFGILGGMGPEATVLLMQRVLSSTKADDDIDHIPMIVHQNTQVPSRIQSLLYGTGADPVPTLQKMASDLELLGCDFLAMPCNTAHYYHRTISQGVSIPFLNMIELTIKSLISMKLQKIGVLASPAAKKAKVFDQYFNEFGLQKIFSKNDQEILSLIKSVKSNQINGTIISRFKNAVLDLSKQGCDGILIGCTEFSILKTYLDDDQIYVDSIDCLTKEITLLAANQSCKSEDTDG